MQGLHLTADLSDCRGDAALLVDTAALRALCLQAVLEAGLAPVGESFHRFTPAGAHTYERTDRPAGQTFHTDWPEVIA